MFKLIVKCLLFGISAINVTFAFYLIKNEKDNLCVMLLMVILQVIIFDLIWRW